MVWCPLLESQSIPTYTQNPFLFWGQIKYVKRGKQELNVATLSVSPYFTIQWPCTLCINCCWSIVYACKSCTLLLLALLCTFIIIIFTSKDLTTKLTTILINQRKYVFEPVTKAATYFKRNMTCNNIDVWLNWIRLHVCIYAALQCKIYPLVGI